ncbi:hypothetical protein E2320_017530, partial [Naja naja]
MQKLLIDGKQKEELKICKGLCICGIPAVNYNSTLIRKFYKAILPFNPEGIHLILLFKLYFKIKCWATAANILTFSEKDPEN